MEDVKNCKCPTCNQVIELSNDKTVEVKCSNCNRILTSTEIANVSSPKKSKTNWFFTFILSTAALFAYQHFYVNRSTVSDIKENRPVASVQKQDNTVVEQRLEMLVNAVDLDNPTTNDFAVRLASQFPGKYNIGQICSIYDYIVSNWKYVNDSDKRENFRSASRTINNNFAGDCDDFAILLAAMVESIGGDARISLAYNDEGGHAFTEVYAANSEEEMQGVINNINELYHTDQFYINYTIDNEGKYWLNLDWFGEPRHPGGKYFSYNRRIVYYPTVSRPYFYIEQPN